MKKSITEIELTGKKVLVRVDYNVPLDDQQNITNDKRIAATLPTLRYLLGKGCAVILMSHLGRPKGKPVASMSLKPCAVRLSELLGSPVAMAPDCVGPVVEKMAADLKAGEVLLLENLRFHPEEEKNDDAFAALLAKLGQVFVQDAFGTVHRAHASTAGIAKYVHIRAAGFLVEKELKFLGEALNDPKRPFLAILGGAKVSDKISVIENLLTKVDTLIIGGAMAYTFLKAQGVETGNSLVEADKVSVAADLMKKAAERKVTLVIPVDNIITDTIDFAAKTVPPGAVVQITAGPAVPAGFMGVDIGPATITRIAPLVTAARTIVWNGPLGVFEIDAFSKGTLEIARLVAEATDKGAVSVIGGGDSVAAVKKAGVDKRVSHISTGGGASLEFLEGVELPGIAALPDK